MGVLSPSSEGMYQTTGYCEKQMHYRILEREKQRRLVHNAGWQDAENLLSRCQRRLPCKAGLVGGARCIWSLL
jgi:hypothetical protein